MNSLTEHDKQVLTLKYKSKRIGKMAESELRKHTSSLILRICVITGWQIPESDEYINIFQDQLRKKLLEDYSEMNMDEFEYALRSHGTKIKDWGRAMNLSLIDEAIGEYLAIRREVSDYEERSKTEPKQLPPGECDWSDEWEKIKKAAQNGSINQMIITTAVYDWLDREGKISMSAKEKYDLMDKAASAYIAELELEFTKKQFTKPIKDAIALVKSGKFTQDEKLRNKIINRAKVRIVKELAISEAGEPSS